MTEDANHRVTDPDDLLNALIRLNVGRETHTGVHLSDQTIAAYLLGSASWRQKREIRLALRRSSAFRRELVNIANELGAMCSAATAEEMARIPDGTSPDFSFYVKSNRPTDGHWRTVLRSRPLRVLVPVVAVLAVVAAVALKVKQQAITPSASIESWVVVSDSLDKAFLIPQELRQGGVQTSIQHFSSAKEAALADFRSRLQFDNGDFSLIPPEVAQVQSVDRQVTLRVLGKDDDILFEFSSGIPPDRGIDRHSIEAWMLVLPSRELCQVRLSSDTSLVRWSGKRGTSVCVTFTYRTEGGFVAVQGGSFGI